MIQNHAHWISGPQNTFKKRMWPPSPPRTPRTLFRAWYACKVRYLYILGKTAKGNE